LGGNLRESLSDKEGDYARDRRQGQMIANSALKCSSYKRGLCPSQLLFTHSHYLLYINLPSQAFDISFRQPLTIFTMRFALLSCLLAVPAVLGAPVALSEADTSALFKTALTITAPSCAVPALNLPAGIVVPAGQSLKSATVGRGKQNYTCTAGAYVSAGAVAE
jgi:hypothetical protein